MLIVVDTLVRKNRSFDFWLDTETGFFHVTLSTHRQESLSTLFKSERWRACLNYIDSLEA